MGRVFKFLLVVVVLAAAAVVGHAVFFELPAPVREITIPVEIEGS